MDVKSELLDAQLEIIGEEDTALYDKEEQDADMITGKIYFNGDTKEILVGTETEFARFKSNSQHLVGDVKTSMLTETEFQTASGDPTWVLADGRDLDLIPATADSLWKSLKGTPIIPDMRGMFLRGKNYARGDAYANPAGDQAISTQNQDHNKAHTHTYTYSPVTSHADLNFYSGTRDTDTTATSGPDSSGAGPESRPKNIIVNYFIKIND